MSVQDQVLAVLDAFNRHDFDALMSGFSDEAILDLPDGIRVIGRSSFRDTLSAYVLRHSLQVEDAIVMTDEAGFKVAVECTLKGQDHRRIDARPPGGGDPYSLPAVLVLERDNGQFGRFSLFTQVAP
ncbi:YybH family protein [Peteryoungia ipomoeae]|uniref:SnoaL-like domain-containing protein n=1 Tax=Peteryoungia ipomoeae TaxID=1210932 RepID=A0A4S8P427_9HYPH|nr:nuclear transport factor 2 family protein [Peteryoungia ipomoeae]THV24787.1 hypothetical protein FAA97_00790 [Peteryoungia ipomoeae]